MFWRKIITGRVSLYKTYPLISKSVSKYDHIRNYSGIATNFVNCFTNIEINRRKLLGTLPENDYYKLQRLCYCQGIIDGDASSLLINHEKELQKITELYPQPRVTLNELNSKTPDKIFEIHFKQNMASPKAAKKKQKPQNNSWTCTYALVWPEKIKFESTALSKRQAQEKSAIQVLHYLYKNRRIDQRGNPIYDRNKLKELKNEIEDTIKISISDRSMERIDKIWNEYENGIKDIYEETFRKAAQQMITAMPVVKKDSTIDEDDIFVDKESSDREFEEISDTTQIHPVFGQAIRPPSQAFLEKRDKYLKQKFQIYDEELTPLPIDQYAEQITSTLSANRALAIVGAAGCGKSTRVAARVLRACGARAAVVVSEPRRVAAVSLAQRVAAELGEQVGESIGYHVRLQSKPPRPPAGAVLYCTSGILLNRLQANPGLEGCTHVFIDEAHERDVNTDITLLLLKRALSINPELKVVIMSATLDVDVFTRYFDDCPVIEVPGRTYPVVNSYLEDIETQYNLSLPETKKNCKDQTGRPQVNCRELVEVIKAVDAIEPAGAILAFLPGWAEIRQTQLYLDEIFSPATHMVLPVHSRLSTTDQTKMFTKPLPGIRKVVLATNVAETSITIPDVVYVIDCGAHKENRVKEGSGTASLDTVWVSLAGARQRAGRAGRLQPGHCYKMYTKEKESQFAPHTTPEILRVPLEQTVLDCKSYAPDDKVENFLSQLPQPPTQKSVQFAVNDLIEIGALTPTEKLTRLGTVLSRMSLHPRLGLALVHSTVLGCVVAAANVLTHCADNVEIFRNAAERREEIRELKRKYSATSDHCALHWLRSDLELRTEECGRRGVRKDRLQYVQAVSSLLLEQVLKSGVVEPTVDPEELNRFSDIEELIVAILLSGTDAILRTKRHIRTKGKLATVTGLFTTTGDRAHLPTSSVNHGITKQPGTHLLVNSGGLHSGERRALLVYHSSRVPPHTPALFAPSGLQITCNDETATLYLPKHRLKIHMPSSQADHIRKAREMLWNTLKYYIERDIRSLDYEENEKISRFKVRLTKAIGRILVEGHREYVLGQKLDNQEEISV